MKSRKPLRRKTYLARSQKPIPPRRKDPKKRGFAKHRCEPFLAWLRLQPCCITKRRTGEWVSDWMDGTSSQVVVDAAHLKTRGTGGDDIGNTVPLSHFLHMQQHAIGWPAFEKRYGLDRHALAKQYADEWLQTDEGKAWSEAGQAGTDTR